MKKLLSLLLVMALILGVTGLTASAAEATISFVPGDLVIVDPPGPGEDPDAPGIEVGGKEMKFGSRKVSSGDQTYFAVKDVTGDLEAVANYKPVGLIVEDPRGLSSGQWYAKVKVEPFLSGGSPTLLGFQLTLNQKGAAAGNGPTGTNQLPLPEATVVLKSGETKPIFKSGTAGSPGKWGVNYQPELLVKGGTGLVATHTAIVLWTVGDTP